MLSCSLRIRKLILLPQDTEERLRQLDHVLAKSAVAVQILKEQMDRVHLNINRRTNDSNEDTSSSPQKAGTKKRTQANASDGDERNAKRAKTDGNAKEAKGSEEQPFEQAALVTGTKLKDYQLEGVAWMAGLHRAGMSGILGAHTSDRMPS